MKKLVRVYADASVYGGNGVNLVHGYSPIAIHTPQEVIADEDQDL